MTKFVSIGVVCLLGSLLSIGLMLWGAEYAWSLLVVTILFFVTVVTGGVVKVGWQFFMPIQCKVPNKERGIMLSFDDGPHENTPLIVSILKKHGATGNFFCIGRQVEHNPDLVQLLVEGGHFVGNHSYSHKATFPMFSKKRMVDEIQKTNRLIEKHTGEHCSYFRPPFGVTNPTMARSVSQLNMKVVGWSLRSFDTMDREGGKALKKIKKNLKSGDIILLHDHSPHILSILEELLCYLNNHNYKTLRVDAPVGEIGK